MRKLKTFIEMGVHGVEVVCWVGRRTSFVLAVNGTLIHSKLKKGKLPDFEQVVDIIKNVAAGAAPVKVTKMQNNSCNIF